VNWTKSRKEINNQRRHFHISGYTMGRSGREPTLLDRIDGREGIMGKVELSLQGNPEDKDFGEPKRTGRGIRKEQSHNSLSSFLTFGSSAEEPVAV